jgi:hypothetical protein
MTSLQALAIDATLTLSHKLMLFRAVSYWEVLVTSSSLSGQIMNK